MNFKIDDRISKKYCAGFSRSAPINEVTIHATAGGDSAAGVIDWMTAGGNMGGGKTRAEDYKKGIGLFHFIIDPSGNVTRVIDTDKWVYHSSSGVHDSTTIGIELVKPDKKNAGEPTDAQYFALIDLILLLRKLYPTIKTISSHDYNAAKYSARAPKPCPGEFNWKMIQDNFCEVEINE